MALTERHVIQEVEGRVLADVAGTVASLGFYVVEVLRVGSGKAPGSSTSSIAWPKV